MSVRSSGSTRVAGRGIHLIAEKGTRQDKALKALCRNLLVGITGSISAVSIPGHVMFLRRGLVETVRVIMTESATRLVPVATLEAYSGHPVYVDNFDGDAGCYVPHIQLTREADAFVVMPATANIIAKAAHGIADDLLSSALVSSIGPVVIVPCMNEQMWRSKAVQRNVEGARANGYHVMEPVKGIEIADLQPTFGAMPPLERIVGTIAELLGRKS
jgi:phosphopantothenoylcysteine decarboxylase